MSWELTDIEPPFQLREERCHTCGEVAVEKCYACARLTCEKHGTYMYRERPCLWVCDACQ